MKSRIEILISSTIISISNFYSVNIFIPIRIPVNAAITPLYISIGTAKGHFSTLSSYPQMLSYARKTIVVPNTQYPSSRNTVTFNTAAVNLATTNYRVVMATSGSVGSLHSKDISIVCPLADARCALPVHSGVGQRPFFGITMCSHFNFMSATSFEVNNLASEANEKCAYRIQY